MSTEFKKYFPIAESIALLLQPYAEVVIHDIKKDKIVGLFNNFSKRKVGDDSLLDKEEKITKEQKILGPYEKINWDGKRLKSISSMIEDAKGNIIGMLCINLDISGLEKFQHLIDSFINKDKLIEQPKTLFKDDWRERINHYIHQYLAKHQLTLPTLTSTHKKKLIHLLHREGAFEGKNAASYVAEIFNISRATVYNYLQKI